MFKGRPSATTIATKALQRGFLIQAPFCKGRPLTTTKAVCRDSSIKAPFLQRKALSNNNHKGFTERFLDAGPLLHRRALSNNKGCFAEIPRQRLLFYKGRPSARTEVSRTDALPQAPLHKGRP